jgi:hypothetical protein
MISRMVSGGLKAVAWGLAATGSAFDLRMAFVNGGGLMLGGLWMRRS